MIIKCALRGISDSILPKEKKMILKLIITAFLEGLRRANLIAVHSLGKWSTGPEPA